MILVVLYECLVAPGGLAQVLQDVSTGSVLVQPGHPVLGLGGVGGGSEEDDALVG